jgi:ketosteroid isomerase-like protein
MRSIDMGDHWLEVIDPDLPEWLLARQRETVDAYRAGDLEWLLEHTHPEIEIVQPPEFPDGRSYCGLEGPIDALLDWPREWEDFQVEPKRIFALDDSQLVVVAVHRGRSPRMQIDIEAEIIWLLTFEDRLTRRWDMFMSLDAALDAATPS